MKSCLLVVLLPVLALVGCSARAVDTTSAPSDAAVPSVTILKASIAPTPPMSEQDRRVAAASLLMPGVVSFDDALAKLQAGVGGIFIPSWASPELLGTPGCDIAALRAAVGRPFDVALDFEGGRVQRFSEILGDFPAPAAMAAHGTPESVEEIGFKIGTSLAAHGITVDFAPVLDVDGSGLSVVGDRSFSSDPVASAAYGAAFARGLERGGVKAVFKHFPGHGRASGDTHTGASVTPPLDELYGFDLVPYAKALPEAPGAGVMVGHLIVPGLGDGVTPASLNPVAYDLLRTRFGFDAVAYTDDLTGMRAITDRYTPAQAVVAALSAGADQALWSSQVDLDGIIDAVVEAADSGVITPDRFAAATAQVHARLNR